jgi:MoaA/NifB/PqqE/SkfB family radical SAM enzyme
LGTTIFHVPAKFSVTILTKCNLRCPLCYFLIKDPAHFNKKGFMPFEDYESILLRYRGHIETVTLTGGEPLLHPEIEKFIDLTQSLNISVGIPTNGTLVKHNIPILKKLTGHFQISLDAYDAKSFNESRRGTEEQWHDIEEGIQLLKEAGIRFNISFLLGKENIHEVFRMLEFAREVGPDKVNLHSFNPHKRDEESILKKGDEEVEAVFKEIMDDRDHPFDIDMPILFDLQSHYFKTKICRYPWDGAYIDEGGAVSYCCHIAHSNSIGNIHDENYDFNSRKMQLWRKAMLEGKFSGDCIYCHRRFIGDESVFDSTSRTWTHKEG